MGLKLGGKVAIWSIDDKGKYAKVSMSTQTKDKENHYFTDWSNKFVSLFGNAYEAVKGITLNEDAKEHLDCRIGWGYERTGENGSKFMQTPMEITNNYDKSKNTLYTNYAIYDLTVTKGKKNDADDQDEEQKEVTPAEEQPAQSGLVGLDFLNIPDGYGSELPFK